MVILYDNEKNTTDVYFNITKQVKFLCFHLDFFCLQPVNKSYVK